MVTDGKDSPERDQTDQGLRTERQETDRALAERQAGLEEDADRVIQRARETADAVLTAARDEADQQVGDRARLAVSRAAVNEGRAREDEAVLAERLAADGSLDRERAETAGALEGLLPLERERTDRYLLTERIRSDEALANRDDFLAMVSHDLRDLLGGVVMSASLVAIRAPDSEYGKHALAQTDRIQRYAARMNRLIGDLLDVASIDAGKLAVTSVRGDLAAIISEAVDTFRAAASAKGIALETEIAEQPLLAIFDHARMLQVFANLIANAMKFTHRGGTIRVHGERTDANLRLFVSDTGTGIPAHQLETIFERFWQVGSKDQRGLGLGLYISRRLVEAQGGRIWAESVEGSGSAFYVILPAAQD
jgi:signal transduction histidine kinase